MWRMGVHIEALRKWLQKEPVLQTLIEAYIFSIFQFVLITTNKNKHDLMSWLKNRSYRIGTRKSVNYSLGKNVEDGGSP